VRSGRRARVSPRGSLPEGARRAPGGRPLPRNR
jgi:hypothetical protein